MLAWHFRCLPGLSNLCLLILLLFCATEPARDLPYWKGPGASNLSVGGPRGPGQGPEYTPRLSWGASIFIHYSLFIHACSLLFPIRLCFSILRIIKGYRKTLKRRSESKFVELDFHDASSTPSTESLDSILGCDSHLLLANGASVVHHIIVPNYMEDIDTLRQTLTVLASHPRAATQYDVCLAMEAKETEAPSKAAILLSTFERSFRNIHSTFHQVLPGELPGKGSNVAHAAKKIMESCAILSSEHRIITVMDADTHLLQDYFSEIRRLHLSQDSDSAGRSLYVSPIIFDRNSHEVPQLVRCADLLWACAGISASLFSVQIPTSVYSLHMSLASRIGGWDAFPEAIGEDMHMALKCWQGTDGNVVTHTIYSAASQCNISSDLSGGWRKYWDNLVARRHQALRHMWGAMDTGYAISKFFERDISFFRLKNLILIYTLFEAHFLPTHFIILLLYSVIYTLLTPADRIHGQMQWGLDATNMMRTASFFVMQAAIILYERFHNLCAKTRATDYARADIQDIFAFRTWEPRYLLDRVVFPVAGTIYGAIPALEAEFRHFFTTRLTYKVSKKPKVMGMGV